MNKNFRTVLLYLVLLGVLVWVVMASIKGTERRPVVAADERASSPRRRTDGSPRSRTSCATTSSPATYWETTAAKTAKEAPKEFTSTYVGTDTLAVLMAEANAEVRHGLQGRRVRAEPADHDHLVGACRFCCWSW